MHPPQSLTALLSLSIQCDTSGVLLNAGSCSVKSSWRSWVVGSQLEGLACKSSLQEPGDRSSAHVEDEGCPEPSCEFLAVPQECGVA